MRPVPATPQQVAMEGRLDWMLQNLLTESRPRRPSIKMPILIGGTALRRACQLIRLTKLRKLRVNRILRALRDAASIPRRRMESLSNAHPISPPRLAAPATELVARRRTQNAGDHRGGEKGTYLLTATIVRATPHRVHTSWTKSLAPSAIFPRYSGLPLAVTFDVVRGKIGRLQKHRRKRLGISSMLGIYDDARSDYISSYYRHCRKPTRRKPFSGWRTQSMRSMPPPHQRQLSAAYSVLTPVPREMHGGQT